MKTILLAFLYMLLSYAVVHFFIKIVIIVVTGDLTFMQFFRIMELHYLFPNLVEEPLYHIISIIGSVVFAGIGVALALWHKKHFTYS